MKTVLTAILLAALPAHADLYRWVDPQTGSVKFSSVPPPSEQRDVEVIPYRGTAAPVSKPAAGAVPELEARWRALLLQLAQPNASRDPETVRQELRTYAALSAELDRLDPAGAERRRAESRNLLARIGGGAEK